MSKELTKAFRRQNHLKAGKSGTDTSKNHAEPPVFHSSVGESWAAILRNAGMPGQLIELVKKAEFEDWVRQQNHLIGEGLYYSEDFQDLPPRFQKKILELAYEISQNYCSPNDLISRLTTPKVVLKKQGLSAQVPKEKAKEASSSNLPKHPSSVGSTRSCPQESDNHENVEFTSSVNNQCDHSYVSNKSKTSFMRTKSFQGEGVDSFRSSANEIENQSLVIDHVHLGNHTKSESAPSKNTVNQNSHDLSVNKVDERKKFDKRTFHSQGKPQNFRNSKLVKENLGSYHCSDNRPFNPKRTQLNSCPTARKSVNNSPQKSNTEFRHISNPSDKAMKGIGMKCSSPSLNNCPNGDQTSVLNDNSSSHMREIPNLDVAQPEHPKNEKPFPTKSTISQCGDELVKGVCDVKSEKKSYSRAFQELFDNNSANVQKCLEIKVSAQPEDVKYWTDFIQTCIKHSDFKVDIASSAQHLLNVTFSDLLAAKQAINLLQKKKRDKEKGVYIVWVTNAKPSNAAGLSKCIRQSSQKVHQKILDKNVESIEKQYMRYLRAHIEKVRVVDEELKTYDAESDEYAATNCKLQTLLAMQCMFTNFTENVMEKLSSLDNSKNYLKAIEDIKADFIRECNCLDGSLPIYSKKFEILDAVKNNQIAIVIAETGSGKSTQLVQYLYRDQYATNGLIICTQPRKVAAISLAHYVGGQMGSAVGSIVGYETGIRKKTSPDTKILYMTDYSLLRRCLKPHGFNDVSYVIVDEAHERSLYTDLLLGMLKKLMKDKKNLKVIITSATIDPRIFLNYFGVSLGAVINVPGKLYPVEVKWDRDAYVGCNYVDNSIECVHDILSKSKEGAILVFLTCPHEIYEAIDVFKRKIYQADKLTPSFTPLLLPLHGKLAAEEQLKIFEPAQKGHRKIIFATNAAETSLTVPDVKYVVDCGMCKSMYYDREKKRSSLVVGFISRASATQRKGRAGRTQPGVCYRLYSESNYKNDMIECSPPEILQSPLQTALLKIMELKIQPKKFDFISTPPLSSIEDAMHSLELLGAVHETRLTDLGRKIAKLPLDPQLGKLVIKGIDLKIAYESLIIAALASVSWKIFTRNEENKDEADQEKIHFCHDLGDFYTFLIVFHEWSSIPQDRKNTWCQKHFVNASAMKIAENMVNELAFLIWNELHIDIRTKFAKSALLRELFQPLLFECFSENLFVYSGHDKAGYISPNLDGSFYIHPSSSLSYLSQEMPQFLVCSVVLRTSRNFLLNVTPISKHIIEKACEEKKYPYSVDLLTSLQVFPVIYKSVGEILLIRYLLGKDGMRLKELEKKIGNLIKSNSFYIDVSVHDGRIMAYVQPSYHRRVSKAIEEVLDKGRCALSLEEEIFTTERNLQLSFALGVSGNIVDVILPGESRDVIIERMNKACLNSSHASKIVDILSQYGPLASHKLINDSHALHATFKKVLDANKAIANLCKIDCYRVMRGKIKPFVAMSRDMPLFRLHVSWNRLSCKGTGSIEFHDSASCIEASYKLTSNSIYVGENYLVVTPSKSNDKTLIMRNLPEHASEQDIMSSLRKRLSDHVMIKNITLDREKSLRTSDQEVEMHKKLLLEILSSLVPPNNFQIEVKWPEPTDAKWTAVVYFQHLEDCQKVYSELEGNITVGKCKANIFLMLKSFVFCKRSIYNVLCKSIAKCRAKYQAQSNSSISVYEQDGRYVIALSCKEVEHLMEMRKEIIKLVEGRHIVCTENPKLSKLFEQHCYISFEEIENATKTHIKLDQVRKIISIYGSQKSVAEAEHLISNMSVGSSIIKVKIFDLHGKNLPTGFLKELYKRYGYDLCSFIKTFDLKRAYIDFEKHLLTIEGPYKRICKAEDHLEDICFELSEKSKDVSKCEDSEFCPICFDKIVLVDSIRLENCGHAACKLCLQLQLKSGVFPVVCVEKDCRKPFFVEDFRKIFNSNPSLKTSFGKAALENFIQQSQSEVRYCPVPDCCSIYRVVTKECQVLCYGCGNYICTQCHCLYHHGMSCEMFQNTKIDEDFPLRVWLNADSANRKRCPKCTTAIEKDGGCNHVVCSGCQSHLCWMCLQVFQSDDDVYEHIPFCENNT